MKSPFPGMDPFLEQHWEDVHARLIGYIADGPEPQLADDLVARMEERVYVEDERTRRLRKPDVRVIESPVPWRPDTGGGSTAVADEPILLELAADPIRQRSVLIYDLAGRRIVTAIELLSPWNKASGRGLEEYLDKRLEYLRSDVNLVEIDLVRTGDWTRMIRPYRVPPGVLTTYRVTVTMPNETPRHYPIPLRAKLPTVRVPLRSHDPVVKLDLQELREKAYAMGRYDRIDYREPCAPALTGPDEEEWVAEALRAAGLA